MKMQFYKSSDKPGYFIPVCTETITSGYSGSAKTISEEKLDISEFLVKHPTSTFYVRVTGSSMKNLRIRSGDLLVVDRTASTSSNSIVLAVVNGEFTVKAIKQYGGKIYLMPANEEFRPIEITDSMDFEIWGVVTWIISEPSFSC